MGTINEKQRMIAIASKGLLLVLLMFAMSACSFMSMFGSEAPRATVAATPTILPINTKTATIAYGPDRFEVIASSLYVRMKASKNSQVVDVLRFGDEVSIEGKCQINGESNWCPISYIRPGEKTPQSGWVNFDFLEPK